MRSFSAHLRSLLVAATTSVLFACGAGGMKPGDAGNDGGNGDAGIDAGLQCPMQCSGLTPVCNGTTCVACTATEGCKSSAPYCVGTGAAAKCIQCVNSGQCGSGLECNTTTNTCYNPNTGGGGGGGSGGSGGSGGGGGSGGSGGGAPIVPHDTLPDGGHLVFNGTGSCAPQDAGVQTCTASCDEGFTCLGGVCVLNGGGGPVQVTLRWNDAEDLDLHLDEPLPNGGVCEIYYGDINSPADPSSCGAVGSLDLDSEAGCTYDGVDIENIIYSASKPAPKGVYTVRVDHYQNCDSTLKMIPYEVEARFDGMTVGLCGVFVPSDADWDNGGSAGDGRPVLTFTVP